MAKQGEEMQITFYAPAHLRWTDHVSYIDYMVIDNHERKKNFTGNFQSKMDKRTITKK